VITELRKKMDRLLWGHRAGRPLALLFDYDGTLVPLVEHPALAKLPPQTRGLLRRLANQPRVTVGILSGRRIDDLKDIVCLPRLCYSGISGLELELDGMRITHPQAAKGCELIARLATPLRELAAAFPGAWVEDKQLGLTLHYRAAAPHQIEELQACAKQLLQSFGEHLRMLDVAMAIEITPALGWTKGSAVWTMAAHAGSGAIPLYAGDEANDWEALEAATALGGVAIGIGPRAPSAASHRLPDPAALVNFLSRFIETLDSPGSCPVNPAGGACNTAGNQPRRSPIRRD
jgi:trehalose 6-phosphate phosphatase